VKKKGPQAKAATPRMRRTSGTQPLKALIIYDDISCAKNAKAMLRRATRRADAALKWDISPWRLDMLRSPLTANHALHDAADAHLIIFAVRRLPRLHGWLMDWLRQWVSCRRTPEAALASIGDGTAAVWAAPATVELSQFARLNGLSFIFNNRGEMSDKSEFLTPDGSQAMSSTSPSPPSFRHPPTGVHDFGWGIND
jgi:hypothetical protein